MLLTIRNKKVTIVNPDPKWVPDLQRWFEARPAPGPACWLLPKPHRHLMALLARYRTEARVEAILQEWIDREWSYDGAMRRIRRHLHEYRGGFQAKIVAQAIADRGHGVIVDTGGGKTVIGLEYARLVGHMLIIVEPIIFYDAYLGTKKHPGAIPRWYGDLKINVAMGGKGEESRKSALREPADVYIVSPYVLESALPELIDLPLGGIEIDESGKFRTTGTERVKNLHALAEKTEFKLFQSASAAPKNIGELHSQVKFARPDKVGDYERFCEDAGGKKTRWNGCYSFDDPDAAKAVLRQLGDVLTYIPKTGPHGFWPDAPPLTRHIVEVELSREQQLAYRKFLDQAQLSAAGGHEKLFADERAGVGRLTKLREVVSGFLYRAGKQAVRIKNACKPPALVKLLTSPVCSAIETYRRGHRQRWRGHQTIVWCYFREDFDIVGRTLDRAGIPFGVVRGERASKAKLETLNGFKDRKFPVLLAQPKTISHGVQLHCATRMIWYSLDYSPDDFDQAMGRVWRPPQEYACRAFLLAAKGTVDFDILSVLDGYKDWKQMLADVLGKMTAERIA